MRDEDKAAAREALERKQLTIDQVEAIRAEVDRTGRSFRDVAAAKGLLAGPKPEPSAIDRALSEIRKSPLYLGLLVASFLIFSGLLIATLALKHRLVEPDDDQVLETARSRIESDKTGGKAKRDYTQGAIQDRETEAREHLAKARAAMARVESILQSGNLPPEITLHLNDAFVGYNAYLSEFKEDALVFVERARTHELRRNFDLAVGDLERAVALKPELELGLRSRIAQLRLLVARKPQ